MLRGHPLGIGVGEWAWRIIYPHYAVSGTKTVMHAHNIFLQVAIELGIVGVVLFLLLLVWALRRGIRKKNIVAVAGVAGVLFMGQFDHLWYYPGMLVPFWSMLAFCCQSGGQEAEKELFVDILHEKR